MEHAAGTVGYFLSRNSHENAKANLMGNRLVYICRLDFILDVTDLTSKFQARILLVGARANIEDGSSLIIHWSSGLLG